MQIQQSPVPDSPSNDAFEAIVELYYQTNGYITSSGKWFWVWDEETKKQRGYQDIDVMALSADETLLVSVTSNLDDKVGYRRDGSFDDQKLKKLKEHFARSQSYLKEVKEYRWLTKKPRNIRCIVAYNTASQFVEDKVVSELTQHGIDTISAKPMLQWLVKYSDTENVKIQDPIMRVLRVINWHGRVEI